MTNLDSAFSSSTAQLTETIAFLRRLAVHLDAEDMPGQAGNCTIQANKLEQVLVQVEWIKSKQ